ncbi:putative mitochondrial protein, partial [Mucuna pruriens]
MTHATPWYADIYNYLVASTYPQGTSRAYKARLESDAKYYVWDDPYLWRMCNDQVIRTCIQESEIQSVLHFYHAAAEGGHYGSSRIARKVLNYGLYWPTIFRDAHTFVLAYEQCQKIGIAITRRNEMPQQPMIWVEAKAAKVNDAKTVVEFLKSNIFCKFGVLKALINDQGSHLCNYTMAMLLEKYRVVHRVAITYHPQTNDQAEVFNREIKKLL